MTGQELQLFKDMHLIIENMQEEIIELQKLLIQTDSCNFSRISNPSEEVKLFAVNKNGYLIQYIKNPSEKLQLAAVNKNYDALFHIKNPTEKVVFAAINVNAFAIRCVKNQTNEMKIAAVMKDPEVIKAIKNPSKQLQLDAIVKSNFSYNVIFYCPDKEKLASKIADLKTIKDIIE